MKRLIVIISGFAMASIVCCLTQQCSPHHGPVANTAIVAPTVEIPTALKRTEQFLQPDTASNLRFGRPANTPRP
jgi:hypothetical protein